MTKQLLVGCLQSIMRCYVTKAVQHYIAALIGGVVDVLEELGAAKVEHELREDGKLGRQAEGIGVIGSVRGELGAQTNERAIDPAENVGDRLEVRRCV